MIYDLSDSHIPEGIGNKATYLMRLKQAGFRVPDGFVLGTGIFDETVVRAGAETEIASILRSLTRENITASGESLDGITKKFLLPESAVAEISLRIKPDMKYAVRSSATKEDLGSLSFAGQYKTFLNISGVAAVAEAVTECYRSLYAGTV
ncbi:MAG: phosphoenolpyruvate synthase, partial [Clostridiales Family XIII bacterium]|nr:phosphoenolpyruvate synthase [Clostridiales Family XIII bacterium]